VFGRVDAGDCIMNLGLMEANRPKVCCLRPCAVARNEGNVNCYTHDDNRDVAIASEWEFNST
jgi:hypothetical protein